MHDRETGAEGAALLGDGGLVQERAAGPATLAPETFLAAAGLRPRGFWSRGDRWLAWAGEAARIRAEPAAGRGARAAAESPPDRFEAVRRRAEALLAERLEAAGPPRLHGGFAFSADRTGGGPWRGFPAYRFSLPVLEAEGGTEGTELRITAPRDDGAGVRRIRDAIERAAERPTTGDEEARATGARSAARPEPRLAGLHRPLGREAWRASVKRILRAIEAGEVRKVVLARTAEARLAEAPDPLELLRRLRLANPRAYVFYFEPEPGRVFLGAAPELLGALQDGVFHSTAVAGTIRRGRTPEEDDALARRLLESEKERAEHRIGVEELCERLRGAAGDARLDREPRVVRLNRVQHLRTDLTARLPEPRHLLSLVGALHPTAAVCGHPREAARRILEREEAFDRGWYAAPVGWFDGSGEGEFAPGLRCGVLRGRRLTLFAGAGIVRGSEPDREWRETRLKLDPLLHLLDGPGGP